LHQVGHSYIPLMKYKLDEEVEDKIKAVSSFMTKLAEGYDIFTALR